MGCEGRTGDIRESLMLLLGALTAALLASASLAVTSQATEIGLRFASKKPGTNTAMTLHIRYTRPGDAQAKPPPIRRVQIDAPAGTAFHSTTVPACEASDAEVMLLGTAACPSASRIADGTIRVITGFGEPFDPFDSPTPVFNDGRGWLEVSQTPSTPITIAVTRLAVTGSRIRGDIAATPGGPPDNQTAVSTLDLSFPDSSGYITTPPTCPAGGRWATTGTFTFGDGTTQIVHGDTPCVAAAAKAARPRIRLSVKPRRARVGRRKRFSFRATTIANGKRVAVRKAMVRFDGRKARTDSKGIVRMTGTLARRDVYRARASKDGMRSGTVSVRAVGGRAAQRAPRFAG